MRFIRITLFFLIFLSITFQGISQTFTGYCTDQLANALPASSCISGTPVELEINVSGLPTLSQNNLGITRVRVDFDQTYFDGTVSLISPGGLEYVLVSSEEGILSLPGFTGTGIMYMQDCDDNVNHDENFNTGGGFNVQPVDNFSALNDLGINPNGTWKIKYCTFSGSPDMLVYCGEIEFGNICPIIDDVTTVLASCPNADDGALSISASVGNCSGLWYSIDGVSFQTSPNFDFLTPGTYTVYVADNYSQVSRTSQPACIVTQEVVIESGDNIPPDLTNCPSDLTVYLGENCNTVFSITNPTFSDDCGFVEGILSVQNGPNDVSYYLFNSGETIQLEGIAVGSALFTYEATDGQGNSSTCSMTIDVQDNTPPVWTSNTAFNLTGICGIDDEQTLVDNALAQLTGEDNCSSATVEFVSVSGSGAACSYFNYYIYRLVDEYGNVNPTFASIEVVFDDPNVPTFSGIPLDITLNCNDSYPNIPNVTASDLCDGNVTANIQFSESFDSGSCEFNTNYEVATYTWTVSDACGNVGTESWKVTIFNDQEVSLGPDVEVCDGENVILEAGNASGSYLWSTGATTSTIEVTSNGIYSVTVTGNSGCCSVDEISVTILSPPTATIFGNEINCENPTINLQGVSSVQNSSYTWAGPGDFTSDTQNPQVSVAGTYMLTVTAPNGCSDIESIVIVSDSTVPTLTTEGGVIDCNNSMVTVSASSSTSGITYSWTGPENFTSTAASFEVTVHGTYNVAIMAENGCVVQGVAVVSDETTPPSLALTGGTINCITSEISLIPETEQGVSYLWTGPDNFSSQDSAIAVTIPGSYSLIVTDEGGCTKDTTVEVGADIASPEISIEGENLNCNNTTTALVVNSSQEGISYQWSGPDGYTSTEQEPTISVGGKYYLTATAGNGCSTLDSVDITGDFETPEVTATGGEVNCTNSAVTLVGTSSIEGSTFLWTGPNGYASNLMSPSTAVAGEYTLFVIAPNGCSASTTTTVTVDENIPQAILDIGMVDCEDHQVTLSIATDETDLVFAWSKDGEDFSETNEVTVSEAGSYAVNVTSSDGCVITFGYDLTFDIQPVEVEIAVTDASAGENNGTATISSMSPEQEVAIAWDNGQTGLTAEGLEPGTHTVVVTTIFGCEYEFTFEISMSSSTNDYSYYEDWKIYPTLTNDYINIKAALSESQSVNIHLLSIQGALIYKKSLGNISHIDDQVDLTEVQPGVYLISVETESGIRTEKVIKI